MDNLNKGLSMIRKATLYAKKIRYDINAVQRKQANDVRRTYNAFDGLTTELKKLVDAPFDTSEFDKVEEEIKERRKRK